MLFSFPKHPKICHCLCQDTVHTSEKARWCNIKLWANNACRAIWFSLFIIYCMLHKIYFTFLTNPTPCYNQQIFQQQENKFPHTSKRMGSPTASAKLQDLLDCSLQTANTEHENTPTLKGFFLIHYTAKNVTNTSFSSTWNVLT